MTLGWGIIGIGNIANRAIAPSIQELPESELVAVVSRDQGRADEFARRHGARCAYTDFAQMLANPDVQVVAITTPNAQHPDQVVAAAKAGKHVLCDKPLALTAVEAQRAMESCRKAGVTLGINFQTRAHACFQRARQIIQDGRIGEVLLVQVEVSAGDSQLRSWRADPALAGLGTIFNIGIHAYDLLLYLLGSEVSEVVTLLDVGRRAELERMALTLFRFASGTMAYVNANQRTPNHQPDIDIYGTKGRILGHGITRPWLDGEMRVLTEEGETVTQESTHDCYRRLIDDFNHAVLEGREPLASGLDGLRSVQLTDAIARSAREGRVVQLEA
jgi:1,5-anhydro-D-fructose reductase (1,5-anhydro-D-mannitol-forming)